MIRYAPLLLLTACTISETNFPNAYARAMCTRLAECEKGQYQSLYADRKDCLKSWSDVMNTILDAGDRLGATYDPSKAAQCVMDIHKASCGEFANFSYTCQVFQ